MDRYVRLALLQAVVLLLVVASVNIVIDPYWRWGHAVPGLTDRKPKAGDLDIAKLYQMERAQPRTLLLGSSRVEVAFDPESAVFPAAMRPIYNFSWPGTGLRTAYRHLRHAADVAPIATVFLGLDFNNFLTADRPKRRATVAVADPNAEDRPTAIRYVGAGQPNDRRVAGLLWDFVTTTLSLQATAASAATVLAAGNPAVATVTQWGFNPRNDAFTAVRLEGPRRLFEAKNRVLVASYGTVPLRLESDTDEASSSFAALRRLLAFTRERGIRTVLFAHPAHADMLEILAAAGLESLEAEWLHRLVGLIAEVNPQAEFWDFRGHHAIATEPVPPGRGRNSGAMRWYWEAVHYKAEVGERMMAEMLGQAPPEQRFGVRLEPGGVDGQLARLRALAAAYRAAAPERVAEIAALVNTARAKSAAGSVRADPDGLTE